MAEIRENMTKKIAQVEKAKIFRVKRNQIKDKAKALDKAKRKEKFDLHKQKNFLEKENKEKSSQAKRLQLNFHTFQELSGEYSKKEAQKQRELFQKKS